MTDPAPPEEGEELIPGIGLRRGRAGRYDGQFRPRFSRVHHDVDLLWVAPLQVRYILAVVGRRWAGKGTVVTYLQEKRGFAAHNLQRIVRAEAESLGRNPSRRAVRQRLGDTLRAEHLPPGVNTEAEAHGNEIDGDSAYLARRALRRIRDRYASQGRHLEAPRRVVMGGFSHEDEVAALQPFTQFHVLRICCSDADRFERAERLGLLDRDLTGYVAEDYPGVRSVQKTNRQAVFDLVDGYDVDGGDAAPWAGTCAHGVGRLMALVESWAKAQERSPAECDARSTVFDVQTGRDRTISDVYERLDAIVDALDQRYLLRRP